MKPLLLLGLLLGLHAAAANKITDEYGFCPKYTIKAGDTIFQIAQDLNVTSDALTKAATDCGADLDPLQIDLEICLPGWNDTICEHVLETDPDRPWCQVYEIQAGDTTTSVAKLFNITEDQLIALNSDYLADGWKLPFAGQYVRIPGWNQELCRDFNDNDMQMCRVYIVQPGDSLAIIAQKFLVSVEDTVQLNGINASDPLQPNFRLKLPQWNESCPPQGIPAELPADTVSCRVAQLGEGESLALLAERYATSFGAIQGVNPALDNVTVLQPGTYVNLPPFPLSCVGEGNLVGVPGKTTVPDSYDYNGLGAPPSPSPATPAAPAPEAEAPVEAPAAERAEAPVPAPAPAPVEEEDTPPTPAPVPTATPPSAATPKSVGSLLCAVLTMLAGTALL